MEKNAIRHFIQRTKNNLVLLFAFIIIYIPGSSAQNEIKPEKPLKYLVSIDMVKLIDKGKFGKAYLKINHLKGSEVMGAYRVGFSDVSLWSDRITKNYNINYSSRKFFTLQGALYLGYEKYVKIGTIISYYGFDVKGWYDIYTYPDAPVGQYRKMAFGICPFWGLKQNIYKNRVFLGLEIGWENLINLNKSIYPTNIYYPVTITSNVLLPYNFTINYNF